MVIAHSREDLAKALSSCKAKGLTLGFVPTMGALHDGHMSLVDRARAENDVVVVSVFVNPTQFNNPDDLRTYPRTEAADAALLEKHGADVVFMPSVEDIYPEPDTRVFDLSPEADVMEGPMRPGHFNGVAQVVSRLFELVEPDKVYLGEKDYQQIAVIRRMLKSIPQQPEVVDCPICRAEDGLALSSRNARLSAEQRAIAPHIYKVLKESLSHQAELSPRQLEEYVTAAVEANPAFRVEYYTISDAETLAKAEDWSRPTIGCITVWLGDVRLIDNIKYPARTC